MISARAIVNRRRMPPDSVSTWSPAFSGVDTGETAYSTVAYPAGIQAANYAAWLRRPVRKVRPDSGALQVGRDTGLMRDEWIHVGRLWTNGEQFLAIDSAGRSDWRGHTDDEFDRTVHLTWQETGLAVGSRMAALVGGDGVVRDDSWVEVFRGGSGALALVQAGGLDYRSVLAAALEYPDDQDLDGVMIEVRSGELAVFTAAADGDGEFANPFEQARPGLVPAEHGPPSRGVDPGLLISTDGVTAFRLKVRWFTELDEKSRFARWLLIPVTAGY
ncbi:hypothetical protein [Micromonospora sp. NPDC049102]|uniref:hypothetical protein n=1 Tax=Micromonospora sp. NPDC049102 TaxID=3364265 RepID=UPI00371AAD20